MVRLRWGFQGGFVNQPIKLIDLPSPGGRVLLGHALLTTS